MTENNFISLHISNITFCIIVALSSFIFSVLIVYTKKWHGIYSMDTLIGIQKFHTMPTPRVGGIPIYIALSIAVLYVSIPVKSIMMPLLLAGLISLIVGLVEDLTKKVGVIVRLVATMLAGIVAWYLTDYSLTRLDIPYIDPILKILPMSVLFTAFAIGGIANAINIIDGLNGLSSLIAIFAFAALSIIANKVGDNSLSATSMLLGFSIFGFMLVNWPYGKLFLGDGGAYFVGFSLAWVSILLAERHDNVSPFVAVLICIYPITEVFFSIYRRLVRKLSIGAPDRLHFHSLVNARYIRKFFKNKTELMYNSIAGISIGLLTIIPATLSIFLYKSSRLTIIAIFIFIYIYIKMYKSMIKFNNK